MGWLPAVQRAGAIAASTRSYGRGIDEGQAIDLLALLLYWQGSDAVDRIAGLVREADTGWWEEQKLRTTTPWSRESILESLTVEALAEQDEEARRREQDRRRRRDRLHHQVAEGLRQLGHDLDTRITDLTEHDPVARAWRMLDLIPASPPPNTTLWPARMMHPENSTSFGRALSTVHHWLREAALAV